MKGLIHVLSIMILLDIYTSTLLHASDEDIELSTTESKEYLLGRFSVQLTNHFQLKNRSQTIDGYTLDEYPYNAEDRTTTRDLILNKILEEIRKTGPRLDGNSILVDRHESNDAGHWSTFISSYQDILTSYRVTNQIVSIHPGVITHAHGVGDIEELEADTNRLKNLVKLYTPNSVKAPPNQPGTIYLKHGYLRSKGINEEDVYAKFENFKLNLTLSIKTSTVHQVEPSTLSDRIDAALLTWVIPGLSVDKIHSGKRDLDGLKGDELIMRTTENNRSEVRFMWNYPGKVDSGEYPNVRIKMLAKGGDLKEQRQVWEQVLAGIRRIPGKIE